jgi:predicted NAD/FAD-dependent oxidoreductase
VDRTRSPVVVSQKREYFKYWLETIGVFDPETAKSTTWRLAPESQKAANGGPFCAYQGHLFRAPDWLAGEAVLIATVSGQIPC